MLEATQKLISVDDHIVEHPNVWTDRLPSAQHVACPHVIELDNGRQAWQYEDQILPIGSSICRPKPEFPKPLPYDQARFEEMREGVYDPKARIADMDIEGVW